jgi:hypothetical protein
VATPVLCKDCRAEGIASVRLVKAPGPRCVTHMRAKKKADRRRAHGLYVERTYGISSDRYWKLYDEQGGKCFICQRATGRSKNLAVDHDHSCCPELPACGKCCRALLCSPCNQLLGQLRDDPLAALRVIEVLIWPPAQRYGWTGWPPAMVTLDQLATLLATHVPKRGLEERIP